MCGLKPPSNGQQHTKTPTVGFGLVEKRILWNKFERLGTLQESVPENRLYVSLYDQMIQYNLKITITTLTQTVGGVPKRSMGRS